MELLGLLTGFASTKVADTTSSEFRGCRVCSNSPYELCTASQHWRFRWLEVIFFPPLLDRENNPAASLWLRAWGRPAGQRAA